MVKLFHLVRPRTGMPAVAHRRTARRPVFVGRENGYPARREARRIYIRTPYRSLGYLTGRISLPKPSQNPWSDRPTTRLQDGATRAAAEDGPFEFVGCATPNQSGAGCGGDRPERKLARARERSPSGRGRNRVDTQGNSSSVALRRPQGELDVTALAEWFRERFPRSCGPLRPLDHVSSAPHPLGQGGPAAPSPPLQPPRETGILAPRTPGESCSVRDLLRLLEYSPGGYLATTS